MYGAVKHLDFRASPQTVAVANSLDPRVPPPYMPDLAQPRGRQSTTLFKHNAASEDCDEPGAANITPAALRALPFVGIEASGPVFRNNPLARRDGAANFVLRCQPGCFEPGLGNGQSIKCAHQRCVRQSIPHVVRAKYPQFPALRRSLLQKVGCGSGLVSFKSYDAR